jgi:hypothetical protein
MVPCQYNDPDSNKAFIIICSAVRLKCIYFDCHDFSNNGKNTVLYILFEWGKYAAELCWQIWKIMRV